MRGLDTLTQICSRLILCFSLASAALALNQESTGSITGHVTDLAGGAIPGAHVTASPEGTAAQADARTFEATCDEEGKFILLGLPPGVYEVRATYKQDFAPHAETNVTVHASRVTDLGAKIKLDIKLDCEKFEEENADASEEDRAEIVRLALREAFVKKRIRNYELLTAGGGYVVIQAKDIKPDWVPALPGINLILMKPDEIQNKADSEGDFSYLYVLKFRVKGSCASLAFGDRWAASRDSQKDYSRMHSGTRYELRKRSGKWVIRSVNEFFGGR